MRRKMTLAEIILLCICLPILLVAIMTIAVLLAISI